jgi:hypothetical protein
MAALACALVAAFSGDECNEALLVRARIDATRASAASAALSAGQSAQPDFDVAATLARCDAAKSAALSLPLIAGLLGAVALGSFALAIWMAKPWNSAERVSYSAGYRARR